MILMLAGSAPLADPVISIMADLPRANDYCWTLLSQGLDLQEQHWISSEDCQRRATHQLAFPGK
jgi:hypothetical protein